MPDRKIERLIAYYANTNPEVAERLRQANELVPQKTGGDRHSPSSEARDQYREAIRAFRQGPATKDTIMRLWQTGYNVLGLRVGSNFEVSDLNYFQDEIDGLAHMDPARKLVYVPDQLETTPEGLVYLSTMYPKMRAWVGKPDADLLRVTHGSNKGGWVHVEAGWKTPYTDTTQSGLEGELTKLNKEYPAYVWTGQRLATYEIGSQDSRGLTRHHFDEQGWVRLLGSFFDGRVLFAGFNVGGELDFGWGWDPLHRNPDLGGRFEGAKP